MKRKPTPTSIRASSILVYLTDASVSTCHFTCSVKGKLQVMKTICLRVNHGPASPSMTVKWGKAAATLYLKNETNPAFAHR